jgi:hypothetical protein
VPRPCSPYTLPSLPGSIKDVLLLVLLGVQNHHHTAGKKEKSVSKLRRKQVTLGPGMILSIQKSPHQQGSLLSKESLSGLLLQKFMLRILRPVTY